MIAYPSVYTLKIYKDFYLYHPLTDLDNFFDRNSINSNAECFDELVKVLWVLRCGDSMIKVEEFERYCLGDYLRHANMNNYPDTMYRIV